MAKVRLNKSGIEKSKLREMAKDLRVNYYESFQVLIKPGDSRLPGIDYATLYFPVAVVYTDATIRE